MPWIESHADLPGHPKFIALCDVLGLSEWQGIGLLHCWWWWALKYAETGDLTGFTDKQIARAAGWDRDAGDLVAGLSEAGFLNADRTIHNWHKYAGRWIERREVDAERNRQNRARARREREAREALAAASDRPSDVRSTGPDRTGPDRTGPDLPPKAPPVATGGGGAADAAAVQGDDDGVLSLAADDDAGSAATPAPVDADGSPGPNPRLRRRSGREPAPSPAPPPPPSPTAERAGEIWTAALAELRLAMSAANFESNLGGTVGFAFEDDELLITVPNPLTRETLEQRFRPIILRSLFDVVGRPCRVTLVSPPPRASPNGRSMFTLSNGQPATGALTCSS